MAKKRIISALVTMLMLITVLPVTGYAIDPIDLERETSLTVWFHDEDVNLPGVSFDLYRVADSGTFAEFSLTGEFAGYAADVTDLDAAGWKAATQTLTGYVLRDSVTPLSTGVTNEEGKVTFPNGEESMMPGLYLVVGHSKKIGGYRYTPEPLLISLPNRAVEEHQWTYDVITSPKYNRVPAGGSTPTEPTYVDRKVLKVWEDGDSENRPESIDVQLLKNGEVVDTVTLSAENNWRYRWSELDAEEEWRVVEKNTPAGYTVTVTQEGITFVMTNTYTESEEPPPPELPGEEPPLDEVPDEEPPLAGPPDEEPPLAVLPQTGQLWWPVPVLAQAGLILFLMGWTRKEKWREG